MENVKTVIFTETKNYNLYSRINDWIEGKEIIDIQYQTNQGYNAPIIHSVLIIYKEN